ncbi:MAG: hypothetical protein DI551_00015 [Micavibrio aeruginosavorus]|uniref:Histidine phosphatase family protein n=1 Tax=Micavibrio aeruginosavorus TaxID=349221 RepID=A0A2W5Q2T6_9BACT|nr:MAG: hypothetical protein DI551_00015 [Micavibrio aeruginosavorus]
MDTLIDIFDKAVQDLRGLKDDDFVMFVLRHAESLGQKEQDAYRTMGDGNIPITDLGVQQGRAAGTILSILGERADLKNIQLISSQGHRSTRTTFEIFYMMVQQHKDLYVNFDHRLDKQKFGDFDGLFTSAERAVACPDTFPAFQEAKERRGIFYARPPNGESICDVQNRMIPFFEERKKHGGATIVVTHGTNALCLEDIPLHRGVQWIVDRLDTRPNCAIRMITGNERDGYSARTICTDPIALLAEIEKKNGFTPLSNGYSSAAPPSP